ncbi:hypothetical protein BBJ28_00010608, partial [Nothophytophthora sp. Chile5]
EREPVLLQATKENSATGNIRTDVSANIRYKLRASSSTESSSGDGARHYDSDRFKLVQSHRGASPRSGVGSAGTTSPRPSGLTRGPDIEIPRVEEPAKPTQQAKKEPPPQPIVPDQIVECVLDAHGYIKTRTYRKGKFLGKGGFARCYELKCEQTGTVYAGKIVAKSSLVKPKAKQKVSLSFTSEIKIHKSLHHAQVVQFEHFFEDSENAYILLELCRSQSLSDLLRRRKRLSEGEVRFYTRQLVEGLAYLHAHMVIHRDLKLGNLFLTSDMRLKIGDFGLATRLDSLDDRKRTMCGTPNYIAPEILSGQRGDGHSFEVDIWSTGVVMYTLLVGRPPFETDDVKATYKRIRANDYEFPAAAHVSRSAQSLIRGILRSNPEDRPSLEQILKHPFLADESVPTSLPRTALLITPPACKNQSFVSRHSEGDRPSSSSNPMRVPPPPAASKRYPLRSRDVNTRSTRGICQDRVSDPGASPSLAQSLPPPYKREGSGRSLAFTSSARRHLASSTSAAAVRSLPSEVAETSEPAQNTLETAYKTLSRFFYLQEHSRGSNNGDHRLSESSSATAIVAAAQRLKEIRAEAEETKPLVPAALWISQWVDYTSKYGIGYMLSNGTSGVYFNDSTKMISSADGRVFEYMERQSSEDAGLPEPHVRYSIEHYDAALTKKVTLLGHFKGYLVDARGENEEADTLESQLARSFVLSSHEIDSDDSGDASQGALGSMVFVKKWVKTRHAVLFQLSNGTVQFNFFDKSKLVLSANARAVTYLDREGDLAVFASSVAILTPQRPDLAKRLRYAKDMLQQMVRPTGQD